MDTQPIIPDTEPITIRRIEVRVLRAPIADPVRTSFGVMTNRPAVVVRIEDNDGAFGWGEIWCNFPACGAEHRARLLDSVLAPHLVGHSLASPERARTHLLEKTHILTLQTREYGPLAQALAGIDVALWDLAARRRGVPLWQLLGGNRDRVPVYASGINPEQAEKRMQESRALGYNAFKIKVGFEPAADKAVVRGTLDRLELNEHLMLDANQAWNLATALDMARHLEQGSIDWLEEPMPVDAPDSDWAALSEASPVPLAGGENLAGPVEFDRAVNLGVLSVLQPDVCKWGGISGCFPVARCALDAGRRLCPHYLGGGIGLIASAHLLAAVGGDGLLEVDSNPNPLRQTLTQPFPVINDGYLKLPNGAGLGVEPDLDEAAGWQVLHLDYH